MSYLHVNFRCQTLSVMLAKRVDAHPFPLINSNRSDTVFQKLTSYLGFKSYYPVVSPPDPKCCLTENGDRF